MILRRSGLRRRLGATPVCSGLDGGDVAVDGHGGDAGPAQAGLAAARVRGRTGGRKPKMTPKLIDKAQRMYDARQFTMAEIAQSCARGHTIEGPIPVSYTHLRAHETRHDLVCRLLLE